MLPSRPWCPARSLASRRSDLRPNSSRLNQSSWRWSDAFSSLRTEFSARDCWYFCSRDGDDTRRYFLVNQAVILPCHQAADTLGCQRLRRFVTTRSSPSIRASNSAWLSVMAWPEETDKAAKRPRSRRLLHTQ